jgi:hypothetical protein
MTPAEFLATYQPAARELARLTGLEPDLFLAQWAVETGWATSWAGAPFNLGNIECGPGVFCRYGSLPEFVAAENAVLHQPNFTGVLDSKNTDLIEQMHALGLSPWDAGHYMNAGDPFAGYKLFLYWEELRMPDLQAIYNAITGGFITDASGHQVDSPLWAAIKGRDDARKAQLDAIKAALDATKAELDAIKATVNSLTTGALRYRVQAFLGGVCSYHLSTRMARRSGRAKVVEITERMRMQPEPHAQR